VAPDARSMPMKATISLTTPSGGEAAPPKNRPPIAVLATAFSRLPGQPMTTASLTVTEA
jgi:hypothetical protein